MKICVIGTGYVGLVAGVCFAEMGNDVICVDKDKKKLNKLKKGIIPIYEPGLEELIISNSKENRLIFTDNLDKAVKESFLCFIAVGTPQGADGEADLSAIYSAAEQIGKAITKYTIIIDKSTVPVGTADKVREIISQQTSCEFDVVSNPEFLKQGAAVDDFLKPDRVIIGADNKKSMDIMCELYAPFVRTGNPLLTMDVKSAEMTKYASNSFLAVKISFANEIANICEKVGADAELVRKGMCADKRIGSQFLFPGLGYGGSCFPKDVKAMINTAKKSECSHALLSAADETNQNQRRLFIDKIIKRFDGNIKDMTFGIWGLAFKPKTNDMREAPSITIINALIEKGAKVKAFDPKAFDCAKEIFGNKIIYAKTAYDALKDADCMLLLTEWNEFRKPDFDKVKNLMKNPIIFDGRNQYNAKTLSNLGFEYHCIGKKTVS